jgi:hypothetical protein
LAAAAKASYHGSNYGSDQIGEKEDRMRMKRVKKRKDDAEERQAAGKMRVARRVWAQTERSERLTESFLVKKLSTF